jgi:signal peptidase I
VWRYTIAVVDGSSMEPTLWAGDRLLVRRCPLTKLRRGDIVVVREPPVQGLDAPEGPSWVADVPSPNRLLVKRAVAIPGDPVPAALLLKELVVPRGAIVILGDHPSESRDCGLYGYVREEQVVGRAIRRLGE